jgi:hypothetical protein
MTVFAADKEVNQYKCAQVMQNLARVRDTNLILDCSDFYWHNGQLDSPPASYSNIIKLLYRYVELEPYTIEEYTTISWLLYSQWVHWKKNPEQCSYGKDKDKESVAVLMNGRRYHKTDADYHLAAGNQVYPLANFYQPQYFGFVIESFELADRYAKVKETKVRARLNLGHTWRHLADKEKARFWYMAVLEIDPENKIAKRSLESLDNG